MAVFKIWQPCVVDVWFPVFIAIHCFSECNRQENNVWMYSSCRRQAKLIHRQNMWVYSSCFIIGLFCCVTRQIRRFSRFNAPFVVFCQCEQPIAATYSQHFQHTDLWLALVFSKSHVPTCGQESFFAATKKKGKANWLWEETIWPASGGKRSIPLWASIQCCYCALSASLCISLSTFTCTPQSKWMELMGFHCLLMIRDLYQFQSDYVVYMTSGGKFNL